MNKRLAFLSIVILSGILLAACGGAAESNVEPANEAAPNNTTDTEISTDTTEDPITVVQIINGTLGDKSFNDLANSGLTQASIDFGFSFDTIEAGSDPAKWEPAFVDAVQNPDVDFIVLGASDLLDILIEYAPMYPDKKFIMFDHTIPFDEGDYSNVYAVQYQQNVGSYLAGLYAGLMSQTGIIGAVGGMDIPVINDFMVGYIQGACDAGIPEENILIQYGNGFFDPAKGKELALTEYQQGADIIFQVAGGTGEGVFYAAEETGNWAIGVDSDQATVLEETHPELSARILTSMQKKVDKSLYLAFQRYFEGTLPFGTNEPLGIPNGVGLTYNKYYEENTPQEVKDKITEAETAILNGSIVVESVF